eukprot:gene24006-biopygen22353
MQPAQCTVVTIAHRLSTVQKIYVFFCSGGDRVFFCSATTTFECGIPRVTPPLHLQSSAAPGATPRRAAVQVTREGARRDEDTQRGARTCDALRVAVKKSTDREEIKVKMIRHPHSEADPPPVFLMCSRRGDWPRTLALQRGWDAHPRAAEGSDHAPSRCRGDGSRTLALQRGWTAHPRAAEGMGRAPSRCRGDGPRTLALQRG